MQSEILQPEQRNEDEMLLALAGLKQVRYAFDQK